MWNRGQLGDSRVEANSVKIHRAVFVLFLEGLRIGVINGKTDNNKTKNTV
jgi:hypothetical protein